MPNGEFYNFYSIGFFFMQGMIVAIATSALVYVIIAKVVNLLWPKPKETKNDHHDNNDKAS